MNGKTRYLPVIAIAILGAHLFWSQLRGFEQMSNEVIIERPTFVHIGTIRLVTDVTALCPGDTVEMNVEVTVDKPMIIERAIQFWPVGVDTPATAAELLLTALAVPHTFSAIRRNWVVPDLPPGDYERHSVYSPANQASQPAGYVMGFTIREGCP